MTNPIIGSKLVDHHAPTGNEVLAYACGPDLVWCDGVLRYPSKLVDYAVFRGSEREVWAYASDCCEYPIEFEMRFVELLNFPPYGISKHIKVQIVSTRACPDLDCQQAILTYSESARRWVGTVAGINIEAYLVSIPDPDFPEVTDTYFQFDASATCLPSSPIIGIKTDVINYHLGGDFIFANGCVFPLRTSETGFLVGDSCCLCPQGKFSLKFFGFCNRRRMARLVDLTPIGQEVWLVGGCCPKCKQADNCCALYSSCDLHATISCTLTRLSGLGGCSWTEEVSLPVGGNVPLPVPWQWGQVNFRPANNCSFWSFYMSCDVLTGLCSGDTVDKLNVCRFTFRAVNQETGCGCSDIQYVDVCACEPLQLSFGLSCHTNPVPDTNIFGCDVDWRITVHR